MKKKITWIVVGIIALLVIIGAASGGSDAETTSTLAAVPTTQAAVQVTTTAEPTTTTEAPTTTTTESAEAFKASCGQVDFRELEKRADALKGNRYALSGEVAQILEGDGETDIRLAVDGDYGTMAYVAYLGTLPGVYDEDSVSVWGICAGTFTYESQAGWNITVPLIIASYVEKL